jgi:hypothetical protein
MQVGLAVGVVLVFVIVAGAAFSSLAMLLFDGRFGMRDLLVVTTAVAMFVAMLTVLTRF